MSAPFHIGRLANLVGVTAKTIRYYEELGLLPAAERSANGYRLYGASDEERLRFVSTARRAGFTLGEIKEILVLRDRGVAPCDYVRTAIGDRLREVDRRLSELRELKRELAELDRVARSLPEQPEMPAVFCHIIEAPAASSRCPAPSHFETGS